MQISWDFKNNEVIAVWNRSHQEWYYMYFKLQMLFSLKNCFSNGYQLYFANYRTDLNEISLFSILSGICHTNIYLRVIECFSFLIIKKLLKFVYKKSRSKSNHSYFFIKWKYYKFASWRTHFFNILWELFGFFLFDNTLTDIIGIANAIWKNSIWFNIGKYFSKYTLPQIFHDFILIQ